MQQITFHAPSSVDETCRILAERQENTRVLAGGQSLIQMLKQRLVSAETIIDISALDELTGIRRDGDTLWIGAGETYAHIRDHELVNEHLPVLPTVISTIGDTQIRNRGTLVGGIAHADPQGDPPVVATALDATIRIRSESGERQVSARDFYSGLFETDLAPDELITEVGFPIRDDRTAAFRSFTPRKGDYAVTSVLATAIIDSSGCISDVEITAGAVSDSPEVVDDTEIGLEGRNAKSVDRESIGETVAASIPVSGDEEWSESYRRSLLEKLVPEALDAVGIGE